MEPSLGGGATHASDDEETSFKAEPAEGIGIDEPDREPFKEGQQRSTLSERLRVAIVDESLEPDEGGSNRSEIIEERAEANSIEQAAPALETLASNESAAAAMEETAPAAKQTPFQAGPNIEEAPPQTFSANGEAHGFDEDFSFAMKLAEVVDFEIDKIGQQPSTLLERLRAASEKSAEAEK